MAGWTTDHKVTLSVGAMAATGAIVAAIIGGCMKSGIVEPDPTPTGGCSVFPCSTESTETTQPRPSSDSSPSPTQTDSESPPPTPTSTSPTTHSTSLKLWGNDVPGDMITYTQCAVGACPNWKTNGIVIGDKTVPGGFSVHCGQVCGNAGHGYIQFKLAAQYSRFTATLGIDADSTSQDKTKKVTVEISDEGSGKILYSQQLAYGKSYPVKLNVSGVGLLRITLDGPLDYTLGAIGDPTVSS